jgi:nucleotide-binding universal stress UspA family protein
MFHDILVPIDIGQEASWRKALPAAVNMAHAFGSRLHVMTVVPDYAFHYVAQYFPEHYEGKMIEDANARLHAFVSAHVPDDIVVQHIVAHGSIYREIVRAAERIGADLVLMASHTPEFADFLIGPNAEKVLEHFTGSVLIVREPEASPQE